jgi:hypothetical protein
MEKSISETTFVAFPLFGKAARLKTYGCIAVVLLAGCMATQNRWQATQMREQVMNYYNDQIMENLIRADEKLPFVHVDITGLTTIDTSQLTGTIGAGETQTHTDSGPIGALNMFSKMVTRPFAYSVSPQRGNSLQISAAPVLGQLPGNAETTSKTTIKTVTTEPAPIAGPTPASPTPLPATVKTTTREDETLTPQSTTIYKLYDEFLHKLKCKDAFCHTDSLIQPKEKYVPGTLKRWGTKYYYIKDTPCSLKDPHPRCPRQMYYDFCISLFTKGQAQSLAKQLQAAETAIQGTRGLQALPPSPR